MSGVAFEFKKPFQYHYGAIKGVNRWNGVQPQVVFQYHYGAIKGGLRPSSSFTSSLFQYHYGAIKGLVELIYCQSPLLFQYQYGAIKGDLQMKDGVLQSHFNTTMVRLRVPGYAPQEDR